MVDEILQQHHHLRADVVEGDGQVTAAVHACKIGGTHFISGKLFFTYLGFLDILYYENTRSLGSSTPAGEGGFLV